MGWTLSPHMQENRKLLELANRHMEKPFERDFKLGEVFSQQSVKAYVQRSYIVLSESEYNKEMGGPRKARDPSLGSCYVMSPQGQPEKVWLFRDPENPHRRLVVQSGVEEVKDIEQMCRSTHFHEMQAQRLWEQKLQECWKDWQLKSVLGQGGHFLSTIDEFKAKLKKRNAGGDDGTSPGESRGQKRERDDDAVDVDDSSDATVSEKSDGEAGDGSEGEPKPAPSCAPSGARSSSGRDFKRGLAKEFEKAASPSIRRTFSSGSVLPSRAATKEFDLQDCSSVAESSAILKKPDHQLSEEDLLAKHVQKTPIMAAMRGDKALGVQAGFAREATKKLGPTLSAQLKGHLKLFNYALSLSPKELPGLSGAELNEAISAVADKVDVWPTAVVDAVFSRRCRAKVERVLSEMAMEDLKDLLAHIKPYKLDEDAELDILQPRLRDVTKSLAERTTQFSDILIGELFSPLIRLAEKGAQKLQKFQETLQDTLEQWMLQDDVPGGFATTLKEVIDFCKGIVPLFTSDPFQQLPHQPALERVKQHFMSLGFGPMCLLANCLREVQYYKDKVTSILEGTLKLKKNELRVVEVQNASAQRFETYDNMTACCLALEGALKSLAYLLEEVEAESISCLTQALVSRVQSIWMEQVQPCLLGKAPLPVEAVALERLCVEATIACPQNEQFMQMQVDLAVYMRDELNKTKVQELMQGMAKLQADIGNSEETDPWQAVPLVMKSLEACKGLDISKEQQTLVERAVVAVVAELESLMSSDISKAKELYDVCVASQRWLPANWKDYDLPKINAIFVLSNSLAGCDVNDGDLDSWAKSDPKLQQLASLMRAKVNGVKMQLKAPGSWQEIALKRLIGQAQTLEENMKEHLNGMKSEQVQACMEKLRPVAGGAPDGQSWCEGLPADAKWADVVKKGRQSLMTIDCDDLESKINDLVQAGRQTTDTKKQKAKLV